MYPIGQVVPGRVLSGFVENESLKWKPEYCEYRVTLLIASQNQQKISAATNAVQLWLKQFGKDIKDLSVLVSEVPSGVGEQPFANETEIGATNRYNAVFKRYKSQLDDRTITIFLAFENGISEEPLTKIEDPAVFQTKEGHAYIDRCCVYGSVYYGKKLAFALHGFSKGVSAPRECVEKSIATNCTRTAGSFIYETYSKSDDESPRIGSPNNWHFYVGGNDRRELMQEAVMDCLGIKKKPQIFKMSSCLATTTSSRPRSLSKRSESLEM